jgi:hypothetical protein
MIKQNKGTYARNKVVNEIISVLKANLDKGVSERKFPSMFA